MVQGCNKTRTNVVHKNIIQGCNQFRRSKRKNHKTINSIEVTLNSILYSYIVLIKQKTFQRKSEFSNKKLKRLEPNISIYLSIYLSTCLSIYLPVYLFIYLSISLSTYLSIYLYTCRGVPSAQTQLFLKAIEFNPIQTSVSAGKPWEKDNYRKRI